MEFFQSQINYLEHVLSQEGVSPSCEKHYANKIHATHARCKRIQTGIKTYWLLQKPHQSPCQYHSYPDKTTEKGQTLCMDRTT